MFAFQARNLKPSDSKINKIYSSSLSNKAKAHTNTLATDCTSVIDTITPRDPLWRDLKLVKGVKLSIEKLEKLKADPVARRMIEKNFYRSIWETNKNDL